MKKFFNAFLIFLLVLSFIGTGYFLYQKAKEVPVVYDTDKPFVTDIVKKTVATGKITPKREIEIKSRVSGVVEELYVEAGQTVKEGQLLAKIRIIPNMVQVNRAETDLESARINLSNSQTEYDRQKKLYNDKIISEVQFQQFKLDYDLKRDQVEAASRNLELVKVGASKKMGQATNLIKSTIDGMILDVPIKEGNFVIENNTFNDGTTIVSVADMQTMIFQGNVDESEVGKLTEDMELYLSIGANEEDKYKAALVYIAPRGVETDGAIQFEIRAELEEMPSGNFLRAGHSANADIVLAKKDKVLALRESNLLFENNRIFVEVSTGEQQFELREIQTGLSDGINIEILDGLSENEEVKKL